MGASPSRLTLYALLSAIEEDLRQLIVVHLSDRPPKDLLSEALWLKALERLRADDGVTDGAAISTLLDYTDFPDLREILLRHTAQLPRPVAEYVRHIAPMLLDLVPIRNRVMHSRPLNFDDLAITTQATTTLLSHDPNTWTALRATVERLKADPSSVLAAQITIPADTPVGITHNLPDPDFDETGFIGRTDVMNRLVSAIRTGPYPVITIVGEGGVGKTALALKVASEFLDDPTPQFDAIVWASSKTMQLTPHDIVRVENAIRDSLGLFENVSSRLAGSRSTDPVNEVLDYLREFRILLILDNLETVLDARISEFLGRLPAGSKVLITSRIGVGAYEDRVPLPSLEKGEAVQLLRAVARARQLPQLVAMSTETLSGYCRKMKNNPLWLKWFVSAVQAGRRPEEVLAHSDLFLQYCMSNVYEHFAENTKRLLEAMMAVPGRHNMTEWAFISELQYVDLQRAVQELLSTNILVTSTVARSSSYETTFEISLLSRDYLVRHHPPTAAAHRTYTAAKRRLVAAGEQLASRQVTNPYSAYSIAQRSRSDVILARLLTEAMKQIRSKRFQEARTIIERAKALDPGYYEVFRVEAWLESELDRLSAAQLAYETAIDLEPRSAPLRLFFAGFLLRSLDDLEGALNQIEEAVLLDPEALEVQLELARIHLYLQHWTEALVHLEKICKTKDAHERTTTRAYDLLLQLHCRHAEDLVQAAAFVRAVEALEAFKAAFQECPEDIRDARMRQKVLNAQDIGGSIRASAQSLGRDTSFLERVDKFLKWCDEQRPRNSAAEGIAQGERVQGVVARLASRGQYGFVDGPGGQYHFNRSSLTSDSDWPRLRAGQRVSFCVDRQKGMWAATNVRSEGSEPGPQRQSRDVDGQVVRLRLDRGFGFLQVTSTGTEYFFHSSAVEGPSGWEQMRIGDKVRFAVEKGSDGRAMAVKVRRLPSSWEN